MIGKTLGNFTVEAQIGKGGMGEVYKAKDQKLGRDVAIKVLPEEFAKDADRVARFQREAKLLASLNHPNIAAIHGLEESDGTHFLVLELIEGDTLADRVKSGPIPVEESLNLALQIAEALEAAHEKGVIHRDLKPANIKVTPDGKVKVLDFGLAKAFSGEHAEVNLSHSPTLSVAATQQGVILGTAAYMSPEQARGKPVDKRTDIWAFGCVLYEMLTGKAAFQGEDVTEILAAVVKSGVNLDLLLANIHPRVREVITRCLQKDQKKRYPEVSEVHYEIEQALADPSGALVHAVPAVDPRARLRLILPWVAVTAVIIAIITGVAIWNLKPIPPQEPRQVVRLYYDLPKEQQFTFLNLHNVAVSADGKQLAYGTPGGLYLRSVNELEAKLIIGTETNPTDPFFSPDGKWIGYCSTADGKLKKIAIGGGTPVILCDAAMLTGASWNTDGTIVYAEYGKGIMRVSANGGDPELLVKQTGVTLAAPQILPDKKTLLFAVIMSDKSQIVVQSLKTGERKVLIEGGDDAYYLSTGHLVYMMGNNLYAAPFDLGRLEVSGDRFPMGVDVFRTASNNAPQIAVSNSGTLVYVPGEGSEGLMRTLVWVDRNGKEEPIGVQTNDYRGPRISPDGIKVAMTIVTRGKSDIWIWDIARETTSRLTFNGDSYGPLWSLNGQHLAFSLSGMALYWKAADGTGVDEELGSAEGRYLYPASWSNDEKTLITGGFCSATSADIGSISMEGDHEYKPVLEEKYNENQAEISPDGRWMAYMSDESGKDEIYVRPFPDLNKGRWQISKAVGDNPLWSPNGRELFYRNGDAVIAVAVETEPTFKAGKPEILFRGTYTSLSLLEAHPWDISPDGKRFLMMKEVASTGEEAAAEGPRKINIVVNWTEELKQRVPVK